MAAQTFPIPQWKPKHNPWAVALTVTLATFMEVLDTSIANVALPHMAGSLGASLDEATWVLTSYLVASAVILPISGWLANRFGRKRFYMSCVVIFTTCSLLCGIAPSLPFLIVARILQGLGGGGLAPSEQAILADNISGRETGTGIRGLRHGGRLCPGDRAHAGWLDYRQFQLALDLLHQSARGHPVVLSFQSHGRRSTAPGRTQKSVEASGCRLYGARPRGTWCRVA